MDHVGIAPLFLCRSMLAPGGLDTNQDARHGEIVARDRTTIARDLLDNGQMVDRPRVAGLPGHRSCVLGDGLEAGLM